MKAVLRFITSVLAAGTITGAAVGAMSSSSSACTPAATPIVVQNVPVDVVVDIGCWVGDILAGTQSLAQIATQCGSLMATQIAALLDALSQGGGIAVKMGAGPTPPVAHVPHIVLSATQVERLTALRAELGDGGAL